MLGVIGTFISLVFGEHSFFVFFLIFYYNFIMNKIWI